MNRCVAAAKNRQGRPILVTGSHRSGSTWIGQMIAQAPGIAYIHEPFHVNHDPGICNASFENWFSYITDANQGLFADALQRTLSFKYNLGDAVRSGRSKEYRDIAYEYLKFSFCRLMRYRPLIKDPIAIFSAQWLASRFNMDVVILIRHPAAFVSSLKRMNWHHPFDHFLRQPLLMHDHLHIFEAEIKRFAKNTADIVESGALLWNIIHHMIRYYQKNHPGWTYVRHEDISKDPVNNFRSLFKTLQIEMTPRVERNIYFYSNPGNPPEAPDGSDMIRRDSRRNVYNWKKRLSSSEIRIIRQKTEPIAGCFYSDQSWQ